jgi:hypothetical protein
VVKSAKSQRRLPLMMISVVGSAVAVAGGSVGGKTVGSSAGAGLLCCRQRLGWHGQRWRGRQGRGRFDLGHRGQVGAGGSAPGAAAVARPATKPTAAMANPNSTAIRPISKRPGERRPAGEGSRLGCCRT